MKVEKKEGTVGFKPIQVVVTIETEEELGALRLHKEQVAYYDYIKTDLIDARQGRILQNLVDAIYDSARGDSRT